MRNSFFALAACLIFASACGGGNSNPATPTTPSAPTTPVQQNRAPTVSSVTISPTFGIAGLTRFSFSASASDPDGDAITYAWDVAGNPFTGANGSITFSGGGDGTARVTVTDNRGLSASDSRTFTVGSMTGTWVVTTVHSWGPPST